MLPSKIQAQVVLRLDIFSKNKYDRILENHPLHGEYAGYRSINITSNLRLIYQDRGNDVYILYNVGTHSQLYE